MTYKSVCITIEQQSFQTKPGSTQDGGDSYLSQEEISEDDLSRYFKDTDVVSITYADMAGRVRGQKTGLTVEQLRQERDLLNKQFFPVVGPNFFHYRVTVSPEFDFRVQDQYGQKYGPFPTEQDAENYRDELRDAARIDRKYDEVEKIKVLKERKAAVSSGSK
jgi:hypothetical protein